MLYITHDNEKILLAGDDIAVINNNSNVSIKNTNIVNETTSAFYGTVSLNNGNTVDLTDSNLCNVVYGGSQLYNKHFDPEKTEHQTFIDYNFPAAKYRINGFRNVYSILVNDGTSAFWVPMNKGLLVGDSFVNDISYIPTRLNGFTTTYTVPPVTNASDRNMILTGNYNGIIVVNQFKNRLTADFVYSLILNSQESISRILHPSYSFNNMHNLQMNVGDYFNNEPAVIKIHNVDYFDAIINSTVNIQISNSNLQYCDLNNTISQNSYNSTFSVNVDTDIYKKYLMSGNTTFQKFDNKNIFTEVKKYEKQLRHAVGPTENDAYISNTPVGSIAWYPEIWTSYKPQFDKTYYSTNTTSMPHIQVVNEGDPFSKDWELCDGTTLATSALYRKLYGKTKTPNYKVNETYTDNSTGYHFLTEAGSIQLLADAVTLTPIKVTSAPSVGSYSEGHRDGKYFHNKVVWNKSTESTNGYVSFAVHGQGCIRIDAYYQFKLTFDLTKLTKFSINEIKNNLQFRIDTIAPTGANWYKCHCGQSNSQPNLPTYTSAGTTYLDGFPITTTNLTGSFSWRDTDGSHTANNVWLNTINVVKVALSSTSNDILTFNCISGNPYCLMNKIQTYSYKGTHSDKHVGSTSGTISHWDGDANYAEFPDMEQYYMKHTYSWKINNNLTDLSQAQSIDLYFNVGFPARFQRYPNKSHKHPWTGDDWYYALAWAGSDRGKSPGDDGYHNHTQFDIDIFRNPRIVYNGIQIPISIPTMTNTKVNHSFNEYTIGNIGGATVRDERRINNENYSFKCSSLGLFRRLNPWIKINNTGVQKSSSVPSYEPPNFNYRTAIQVRKENIENYNEYNFDAISDNLLSCCYKPPTRVSFKNNIVNFQAKVYEQDLKNEQNITIYFNENPIAVGTLYTGDTNYYYIILDETNKNNLEAILSIEQTHGGVTSDILYNNTYTLKKYHTLIDRQPLQNDFNYTFWYISSDTATPTRWDITSGTDLITLAANTTMLDKTVEMVKNLKDVVSASTGTSTSAYFNSSENCIPVLRNDYIGEEEGTGDSAKLKRAYYFLGTEQSVLSAYDTINGFGYNITFNANDDTRVGELGGQSTIECKYLSQVAVEQVSEGDEIYYLKTEYIEIIGVDNIPNPLPEGDSVTYWAMIPRFSQTASTQITQQILDDNAENEDLNNNSSISARYITLETFTYGAEGAPSPFPTNASAYLINNITLAKNKPISTYAGRLNNGDIYTVQVTSAIPPNIWNTDIYRCLSSYVTHLSSQINTITSLDQFYNIWDFEEHYDNTRRQLSGTPLTHDDWILDRI